VNVAKYENNAVAATLHMVLYYKYNGKKLS